MGFVGVRTSESPIGRFLPVWAEILGLPAREPTGFDLPVGASPADYRDVITRIARDPAMSGALITSHPAGVYQSARDLFDALDPDTGRFGAISVLSKKDGVVAGHALDPVAAGLAMAEFVPAGHFGDTGGELLCLGAGTAGTAVIWHLAHRADAPRRIFCTDKSSHRLAALRAMLRRERVRVHVDTVPVTGPADGLIELLPPGSMVVNATGMGADTPGSPISGGCEFPPGCLVWEINFCGALDFLATARARAAVDGLTVADGWRYFVHGWAQAVAAVHGLTLTGGQMRQLSDAAAAVR